MLLALVGGGSNEGKFRNLIHILLVGPPSTGKTTLLLAALEVAEGI